jgi:ABC-type cobalamin transport system permease subunit
MRLIIAKVLFNFDLELVDKTQDWLKGQKVFALWQKPSLMVELRPVKRWACLSERGLEMITLGDDLSEARFVTHQEGTMVCDGHSRTM